MEDKKVSLTHEQLLKALYFILDLFSRPNIPFFLLGETAYCVKNKKLLTGDKITVGIRKLDFQKPNMSIMEAFYLADTVNKKFIEYTFEGVPIEVKIIDSPDPMFTSLDSVVYQYEYFKVPNPFNKYWENRKTYEPRKVGVPAVSKLQKING